MGISGWLWSDFSMRWDFPRTHCSSCLCLKKSTIFCFYSSEWKTKMFWANFQARNLIVSIIWINQYVAPKMMLAYRDAICEACNRSIYTVYSIESDVCGVSWLTNRRVQSASARTLSIRNPIAIWPECKPFDVAPFFCHHSRSFVNAIWWPAHIRHTRLHPNFSVDNFLFKKPRDQYWVSRFGHKKLDRRFRFFFSLLLDKTKLREKLMLCWSFVWPIGFLFLESQFTTVSFSHFLCVRISVSHCATSRTGASMLSIAPTTRRLATTSSLGD